MRYWLRRWGWTVCKALLAAAILFFIGSQFYLNLSQLELGELTLRPLWLVLSAALYLLALGASAWFWHRLLRVFGQRPDTAATVRAYYLGHLGKYVPGKAWALFLRGNLVRGPGVRLGVAVITAFYEVLTTMAAGALLGAVLFTLQPPAASRLAFHPVLLGMLLLALMGVPLLPAVFNLMVRKLEARFRSVEALNLPRLRAGTLLQGLAVIGCGWLLMGTSLWALVQAVVREGPHMPMPEEIGHYTAMVGLAYVAGFLAFMLPSGVGVREGVLGALLGPELVRRVAQGPEVAMAVATVVVLLLRLVWTAAELLAAAAAYWLPGPQVGEKAPVEVG